MMIEIINDAIDTYEKPLEEAESPIDKFEADGLRRAIGASASGSAAADYTARSARVTQMRADALATLDVAQRLAPASEPTAPLFQDLGRTPRACTPTPMGWSRT